MWDSWILADDELVWSESASISSPILQRHNHRQEIPKVASVKTTSVSNPFARRPSTNLACLSRFQVCQGASASTICRMPAYSLDCAKSPRNSELRTTVRGHDIWSTEVAAPCPLESGPHHGGRGVPSCCMRAATWKFVP